LSLRAAMTSSERTTVINRFNDPNDTCDLLVVSARSFGQGVNLQRCCAKLVIIDLAENINSILQMIGRLHRLGQSKIQEIFILTLDHR
jgi:SNF2 family DNA or RNA helicase